MNTNGYTIRHENSREQGAVEDMVRSSFWNIYRPGASEHYVLHVLRKHPDFVDELNLVMEMDGKIIGQSVCVKSQVHADDGRFIPTLSPGPICIDNECKRKGYGKRSPDFVFARAKELGCGAVLFEGNIDFYGKSGCVKASTYGIRYQGLPEGEDVSFFLCKLLQKDYFDGIGSEYIVPDVYHVSDEAVELFDSAFPAKEKLKFPGQIFS